MVPAHSIKVSRVSMYSGYRHVIFPFAYGAFTLSGRLSQNLSARIDKSIMRSEPRNARIPVWPLSISLAATLEIDVSRLSSALSAKASTLRSFLLDLVYSFYSVRNWVFAFNNADRIASILNFRSFGLVVNFVYDILGCLDKKSFSSKSSV